MSYLTEFGFTVKIKELSSIQFWLWQFIKFKRLNTQNNQSFWREEKINFMKEERKEKNVNRKENTNLK